MPAKKRGSSSKVKKTTPVSKIEKKLSDDEVRIKLLKTEVHYFKGLAITITVLIFCVFIAFGVLFSSMYVETRATRVLFQDALQDVLPESSAFSYDYVNDNYDLSEDYDSEEFEDISFGEEGLYLTDGGVNMDFLTWLSFSKYGVTVYFPNSWTYFDRPYDEQLHFFADGLVRSDNSTDVGDFVVSVLDENPYADLTSHLITLGNKVGFRYELDGSEKIIVARGERFIEISYTDNVEPEVLGQILESFDVIE